jgi:hypothetical protein
MSQNLIFRHRISALTRSNGFMDTSVFQPLEVRGSLSEHDIGASQISEAFPEVGRIAEAHIGGRTY